MGLGETLNFAFAAVWIEFPDVELTDHLDE